MTRLIKDQIVIFGKAGPGNILLHRDLLPKLHGWQNLFNLLKFRIMSQAFVNNEDDLAWQKIVITKKSKLAEQSQAPPDQ